jgi:hypothetical protein
MLSSYPLKKCKKFTQKSYRLKTFLNSNKNNKLHFSVTFFIDNFFRIIFFLEIF